jgi:2,4-dienoyl-CoA reductase-like NADH-dependent reductase (Old Yellow Enzyme family)/NADPH-dependent 2,4-dienoyl-CoA reductase/sulfur reductase-like enzyme
MTYEHIFRPLRIGRFTVKNRIESAPAVPFLASSDYTATRELVEWARAMARGGAAVVTMGDSSVTSEDAHTYNHPFGLDLGTDNVMNGLAVLTETVHRYGARASIELNLRDPRLPADLTVGQIHDTIEAYGEAAVRCLHAGMDMIMVHGGHGHLVSRFFSPADNARSDAYGGSFENRSRFAREILEGIRKKVGDSLSIEYRLSADELRAGAPSVAETIDFCRAIEGLVDLFHVSVGCLYNPNAAKMMIQSLYIPRGLNTRYAEEFKKVLKKPVTTVGSMNMQLAEEVLAAGKADMVAMMRSIVADPDCVEKARKGKDDTIRPCIRCNNCIGPNVFHTTPLRCAVNPRAGRETEFLYLKPSKEERKVVIVGGGPAGMEAARVAADRGHDVVLFEKEDHLGGVLVTAAVLPFKSDVKNYLDWAIRMTANRPDIEIRLSTEATPELIRAEKPDVLIFAAGAKPIVPPIPGVERNNVVWAGDVDTGKADVGKTVLLAGAGLTGCETAVHLAQQGKKVTIIDMLPLEKIGVDEPRNNTGVIRGMLAEQGVEIRDRTKLEAVTETGAVVVDGEGKRIEEKCDTVVLSLGVRPEAGLIERFGCLAPDVRFIGDCNTDRGNLRSATFDGSNAAMDI